MSDFGVTDTGAFRQEARAWLAANFPAELRTEAVTTMEQMEGGLKPSEAAELWRKRIGEEGWGTPTWPKEYGGGGLGQAEARVLADEMSRIGARNPILGMGPGMFGHTLLEYGSEARAGARASQSQAPGPTSPRSRPRRKTRAITIWSTARRSGPPAPSSPTGASAWSAQTRRPKSTRGSASS